MAEELFLRQAAKELLVEGGDGPHARMKQRLAHERELRIAEVSGRGEGS